MKFMLLSALLYLPLTLLFVIAMREQGSRIFATYEWLIFSIIAAGTVYGLYGLAIGVLRI